MSKTGVLLVVSLALNAFFIVLFAQPLKPSRGTTEAPLAQPDTIASGTADVSPSPFDGESASEAAAHAPVSSAKRAGATGDDWKQMVEAHVAELRRRGVDEATIRRLAVAEIERLFQERARELLRRPHKAEYWETARDGRRSGYFDPEKLKAFQQLRREKLAQMRALLGDDYPAYAASPTATAYLRDDFMDFDYMPIDKRVALLEYLEKLSLESAASGMMVRARLGANPFDDAKRDEEIREILGAELFEEYFRRSSATAQQLRHELASFHPTRAEFDALLAIERESGVRGRGGVFDPVAAAKMQTAQEQKIESVRAALGDERFAEYERANDWAFRNLDQLTRELNLEQEVAQRSFAHVERARAKVAALGTPRDMRDAATQAAVAAIQKDLVAKLSEELGLQDYNEQERQMLLGPAMNLWTPQRMGVTRAFRRGP
ncbi:MAG TPA: hypothetical protein VJ011_05055 [Steroidobacteraceae bacterium]|nr:hypothetical protein [Steroidobacteraceae bacterium]